METSQKKKMKNEERKESKRRRRNNYCYVKQLQGHVAKKKVIQTKTQ
jgi:hypothetical protein